MPTLTGTVTDGYGAAQRDVKAGVYPGTLYPGTLNLTLDGHPDLPPAAVTVSYAGIVRHLWPANVNRRFVWVLHADHLGATVELLADVRLRDLFDLSNGDRLKVTL